MKTLISNNGGYKLFLEIKPIPALKNLQHELRFTTVYENSKDPEDEQVKLQLVLDEQALAKLKTVISGY